MSTAPGTVGADVLRELLALARWAPSGDNTQPWRFRLLDDRQVRVIVQDTRAHCVYDLDGIPTRMALGALVETLAIAARARGLSLHCTPIDDLETRGRVDRHDVLLRLAPPSSTGSGAAPGPADPPTWTIRRRSVQRRPMSVRPLRADERHALAAQLAPGYQLVWFEGLAARWRLARLLWINAGIRLTLPEAHATHRDIIDWKRTHSRWGVPDAALGVDRLTRQLMRWALQDWRRVDALNRWAAGTVLPRLQMDLLPTLACSALVAIVRDTPPHTAADHLDAGRQMQRLWLGATALGLQHQPAITPLVFTRYLRDGVAFTRDDSIRRRTEAMARQAPALLGDLPLTRTVWLGRLGDHRGEGRTQPRSWRLRPDQLLDPTRNPAD